MSQKKWELRMTNRFDCPLVNLLTALPAPTFSPILSTSPSTTGSAPTSHPPRPLTEPGSRPRATLRRTSSSRPQHRRGNPREGSQEQRWNESGCAKPSNEKSTIPLSRTLSRPVSDTCSSRGLRTGRCRRCCQRCPPLRSKTRSPCSIGSRRRGKNVRESPHVFFVRVLHRLMDFLFPLPAVIRLGKKKEKDPSADVKSQTVEGITRLICLSKAQTPLRGEHGFLN